jgi:hypothetical protein
VLPGDSLPERIKRAFRQKPRGGHLADLSVGTPDNTSSVVEVAPNTFAIIFSKSD